MQPCVCIVVVNYNGLRDTRKCLSSLQAIPRSRRSTVVVDNASSADPIVDLRREFPWCDVIRNAVNGGWAGGNNVGIRRALERGAEQIILLNNDTIVSPRLVDGLLAAARARPEFGILGPVIHFMDEPDVIMTEGTLFNRRGRPGFFQRLHVQASNGSGPAVTEVDIVNGCCMMVRADVFRKIGLIDERFFLIHEESDFCLRARRAGFRCGVLGEALVWHKGSSTFKRSGRRLQRYYDTRNLSLLLHKHAVSDHRRRGSARSMLEYVRYAYYRYVLEREAGQDDAAAAVLEGLCDAAFRRFGPFVARPRPFVHVLGKAFDAWHRCSRNGKGVRRDAAAVR
jgi:GT2 family glycosyltransferase